MAGGTVFGMTGHHGPVHRLAWEDFKREQKPAEDLEAWIQNSWRVLPSAFCQLAQITRPARVWGGEADCRTLELFFVVDSDSPLKTRGTSPPQAELCA